MNEHSFKQPTPPLSVEWGEGHHSTVMPTGAVLTIKETAARLKVSTWTVYELIRKRELASFKLGRRRCVPVEAIQELVAMRLAAEAA